MSTTYTEFGGAITLTDEELYAYITHAERLAGELQSQLVIGALRNFGRDLESIVLDELPPFGRMAALIRPLARIAGPGEGLVLDLPKRLLDEEFGAGEIMRFEDVDFPTTLTHEPTRRFLRETGLPEDGVVFQLDTEVPLPTLSEYYADERPGDLTATELPAAADRLIRLGHFLKDTDLVVDGTTGAVLTWNEPDLTLRPLNADISTLAFTLWLLHREQSLTAAHGLTHTYGQLAATMTRTLITIDHIAYAATATATTAAPGEDDVRRHWPEIFEYRPETFEYQVRDPLYA